MEMNPFKPLVQFYEEFQDKSLSVKTSLSKIYLKINKIKVAI